MATGGECPPSNPQECGATSPREDLETHREVPRPLGELGSKDTVPHDELEKHSESSPFQHHMSILSQSQTTLQAENVALKEQYAALKEEHARLEKEHAKLEKDHTEKLQAVGSVIEKIRSYIKTGEKNTNYVKANKKIVKAGKKIHNIIANTSMLNIGDQLSLSLSESRKHYIIVSGCKFRLTWSRSYPRGEATRTKFKLYSVSNAGYPGLPATWKCDVKLNTSDSKASSLLATICCGESQSRANLAYLLGIRRYQRHVQEVRIEFAVHEASKCGCGCHDTSERRSSDLTHGNGRPTHSDSESSDSDSESSDSDAKSSDAGDTSDTSDSK